MNFVNKNLKKAPRYVQFLMKGLKKAFKCILCDQKFEEKSFLCTICGERFEKYVSGEFTQKFSLNVTGTHVRLGSTYTAT